MATIFRDLTGRPRMLHDHRRGYIISPCGCCMWVFRAEALQLLREQADIGSLCKVQCSDPEWGGGLPGFLPADLSAIIDAGMP